MVCCHTHTPQKTRPAYYEPRDCFAFCLSGTKTVIDNNVMDYGNIYYNHFGVTCIQFITTLALVQCRLPTSEVARERHGVWSAVTGNCANSIATEATRTGNLHLNFSTSQFQ